MTCGRLVPQKNFPPRSQYYLGKSTKFMKICSARCSFLLRGGASTDEGWRQLPACPDRACWRHGLCREPPVIVRSIGKFTPAKTQERLLWNGTLAVASIGQGPSRYRFQAAWAGVQVRANTVVYLFRDALAGSGGPAHTRCRH